MYTKALRSQETVILILEIDEWSLKIATVVVLDKIELDCLGKSQNLYGFSIQTSTINTTDSASITRIISLLRKVYKLEVKANFIFESMFKLKLYKFIVIFSILFSANKS